MSARSVLLARSAQPKLQYQVLVLQVEQHIKSVVARPAKIAVRAMNATDERLYQHAQSFTLRRRVVVSVFCVVMEKIAV